MAQKAQDDLDGEWRAISVSQYNPQNLIYFIFFYSLGHPVYIFKILVRDHEIAHNICYHNAARDLYIYKESNS